VPLLLPLRFDALKFFRHHTSIYDEKKQSRVPHVHESERADFDFASCFTSGPALVSPSRRDWVDRRWFSSLTWVWGLLWVPRVHIEESPYISSHLGTSSELAGTGRVAGVSAFLSMSYRK
jgi:hypothetical protein